MNTNHRGEHGPSSARRGVDSRYAAAFLLACCLLLGAAGCAGHAQRDSAQADDEFASGGDRPPNANTLHALARILASQGRDTECEYLLSRILQQHPGYLPAYSDLAELYLRSSRLDEASRILNEGLARVPQDPVLLNNLGMCHFLRAEYDPALEAFAAAAAVAPNDLLYRGNQAAALGMLGQFEDAARLYRTMLPSPVDVEHNLAVLRSARLQVEDSPEAADPNKAADPEPHEEVLP